MLWFTLWLACVVIGSMMATSEVGPVGCVFGVALGTLAFVVISIVIVIIMAFNTNYCKEYGYPENAGDTCSDSDTQYYIEHNGGY